MSARGTVSLHLSWPAVPATEECAGRARTEILVVDGMAYSYLVGEVGALLFVAAAPKGPISTRDEWNAVPDWRLAHEGPAADREWAALLDRTSVVPSDTPSPPKVVPAWTPEREARVLAGIERKAGSR